MAVAAYVSLLSLTHVLDNLHYRAPFHLPLLDIKQVESLQQNVQFLLDFVELHSEMEFPEIEGSWRQISKIAFETEEMIDFHVVNLLYLRSVGETSVGDISIFCDDMERMISEFDIIKKDLPEIHEACKKKPAALVPAVAPSATTSSGKNVVVGFDEHVVHINDQLTRNQRDLQVLPIVGMGGIGKTTLARCVFDDSYVVNYFDRRIWLTISQDFSVEQILMGFLFAGNKGPCDSSADELGERLYKELFGRKYLIVMDDVWSTEAWNGLKRYFPDNANGSRILVTTRLLDVATCLGSLDHYPLSFLDQDNSWDLFCQITFAPTGNCPIAELQQIGRNIAKSCRGLPLEISVIGRLLANSDMTQEYWGFVAENLNSFGNLEDNEHCLKVLSLSYESLPINLKPCFLYLRVLREDEGINVDDLIKGWVAEGFIKPESDKSLAEIAKQYMQDLISRNLIYKIRPFERCGVHDLLRDLCVRESNKESFIESPKFMNFHCYRDHYRDLPNAHDCCLCGGSLYEDDDRVNIRERIIRFPPTSQDDGPFSCDACQRKYSHITRIKLVMAMNLQGRGVDDTLYTLELPTELRILTFYGAKWDFQMIHLLWNIHTLTIFLTSCTILPPEILEMPQLRQIHLPGGAFLADHVAPHIEGKDFIVLKDLHTLGEIKNFKCTKEVLDRVPNLKSLHIGYINDESVHMNMKESHHSLCNLVQLQKLEFLFVRCVLENIAFPNSLKKLIWLNCQMAWKDMSIIGSLPVLEGLELDGDIKGSEWNPVEGEFNRLKALDIGGARHLECWRADSIHFPNLERLILRFLFSLEGIPLSIGDIPTLQLISVYHCNDSVVKSAEQIMEDQQEMGNETLQIYIDDSDFD